MMGIKIRDRAEHPTLGPYRARKVRFGSWVIEAELPCINGPAAWFTVAMIAARDDAERLMSEGHLADAQTDAENIAKSLNRQAQSSDQASRHVVPPEPRPWQSACIDTVLNELPEKVRKAIPQGVKERLAVLVTPAAPQASRYVVPPEWQPIETAPCDDTFALVYWRDGNTSVEDLDHDSDPAWWRERGARFWMPLPPAPGIEAPSEGGE